MLKRRDFVTTAGAATAMLSALSTEGVAAHREFAPTDASGPGASTTESRSPTPRSSTRPFGNVLVPTYIDTRLDSRSVSFENPGGARGSGGKASNGRKGRPFYILEPGETVVLADLKGPGTLRHFWAALVGLSPEVARALRLEVFYDGLSEPSISVPILDFFGLPHGRLVEYYSALISINGGRGINSHIPMPFRHSIRVEFANHSARHVNLFYQIDYTLEPFIPEELSYLHVTFRRENPTTPGRDFVIAEGFKGPGRFLGCSVGIRVIDQSLWYGEGEVKIYRDGDRAFPTYCGTGLEDYVGSAGGMERHHGPYAGAPIHVMAPSTDPENSASPHFVSFYRWHLPDPVMFSDDIRVTVQQIGIARSFKKGQEAAYEAYRAAHVAAGPGWILSERIIRDSLGLAIVERSDDYCAAAFVYCRNPQVVPRYETDVAVRDISLLPVERKPMSMSEEESERFLVELKKYWSGRSEKSGT